MKIIDSNALVVLLIGLMDPRLLRNHKRTSIYDEDDFYELLNKIGDLGQVIILPNVWTEVDNLLNNFSGNYKYSYISTITNLIKGSTEIYISSDTVVEQPVFYNLGLTDSLILEQAKKCQLLITSDSRLSDFAIASGIAVYDMIKAKNEKLK
jgi:rRNA-processing protein FCF1